MRTPLPQMLMGAPWRAGGPPRAVSPFDCLFPGCLLTCLVAGDEHYSLMASLDLLPQPLSVALIRLQV